VLKIQYLLAFLLIGSVAVGTAFAAPFLNENVIVDRTLDLTSSAITVKNAGFENSIKLWDVDNNQIFQFRVVPLGDRLEIVDITHNVAALTVRSSTGNVGIGGLPIPTEQLDVNGNTRVRGNLIVDGDITSATDICIGSCP